MAQTKVKLISDGVIDVGHLASGHGITTDNIGEGSNLYYTDARVSTYLSTNSYATEGYVTTAVANLVDSAPTTLDTLNELAAALGDDPNFATTVTNSIATKLPLAGGTLTGTLYAGGLVRLTGTTSSNSQLDLPVDWGALRWYDGTTFKGGIGTAGWSGVGSGNDLTVYLNNGNFHVSNNTSPFVTFDRANERVGISTTSPAYKLHVAGEAQLGFINFEYNGNYAGVRWKDSSQNLAWKIGNDSPSGNWLYLYDYGLASSAFTFKPNSDMCFTPGGKIGIGTTSPEALLDVKSTHSTTQPSAMIGSYATDGTQPYGLIATADEYHGMVMRGYPNNASTYGITYGDYMSFYEYGGVFRFYKKQPGVLSTIAEIQETTSYVQSNLAINKTTAGSTLDVNGNAYMQGSGTYTLALNRMTGQPTIKGVYNTNPHLIIDSHNSTDAVFLQNYNSGNVYLATGGGKVGIGFTSPNEKLHVQGKVKITDDLVLSQTNPRIDYDAGNSGALRFFSTSSNAERMRITSGGNVGIGTTGPNSALQVMGNLTVGAMSPSAKVNVDGAVLTDALWLNDDQGWLATLSPEGWHAVVQTGTISSTSTTSLDILSVYTDGHWGGGMYGEIWVLTRYYGAGYKRYSFKANRAGYVTVTLLEENGYETYNNIDVHSTSIIGSGTHNGQSVAKSVIRMNTTNGYANAQAIIKIGRSDNSHKVFDNRSTDSNVQSDRITNGGAYHFRTVNLSDMPNVLTV